MAALAEVEAALKSEEAFQADLGEALRGTRAAIKQHFAQLSQALARREEQLASELAEVELLAAQRRTALTEAKQQLGTPGVRSAESTLTEAAAAVSRVPKASGIVFTAEPSINDVEKTISTFGRIAHGRGRDYVTTLKAPKRVFGHHGKGSNLTLFDSPGFVRVDASDNIFLLDSGNSRVLVFKPNGVPLRAIVPPEGFLDGLALDPFSGNIVLVHGFLRKVRVYDPDGSQMLEFGTLQRTHYDVTGEFRSTEGIVIDTEGRFLVVDKEKSRVIVFEPNGSFLTEIGCSSGPEPGQFKHPESAVLTPSGDVVVVDCDNHRLQIFSGEDWSLIREFGSEGSDPGQFYYPRDAAVDAMGNIIVADTGNHRVVICTPDGKFITSFGVKGEGPAQFYKPRSVAVNSEGQIIVLDYGNCRVQIW
jgi:hypothetical protein